MGSIKARFRLRFCGGCHHGPCALRTFCRRWTNQQLEYTVFQKRDDGCAISLHTENLPVVQRRRPDDPSGSWSFGWTLRQRFGDLSSWKEEQRIVLVLKSRIFVNSNRIVILYCAYHQNPPREAQLYTIEANNSLVRDLLQHKQRLTSAKNNDNSLHQLSTRDSTPPRCSAYTDTF